MARCLFSPEQSSEINQQLDDLCIKITEATGTQDVTEEEWVIEFTEMRLRSGKVRRNGIFEGGRHRGGGCSGRTKAIVLACLGIATVGASVGAIMYGFEGLLGCVSYVGTSSSPLYKGLCSSAGTIDEYLGLLIRTFGQGVNLKPLEFFASIGVWSTSNFMLNYFCDLWNQTGEIEVAEVPEGVKKEIRRLQREGEGEDGEEKSGDHEEEVHGGIRLKRNKKTNKRNNRSNKRNNRSNKRNNKSNKKSNKRNRNSRK